MLLIRDGKLTIFAIVTMTAIWTMLALALYSTLD
jgi:hypothetical protein